MKRSLKKSASQVYFHTNPSPIYNLPPPQISSNVTVSVPPIPPHVPSVFLSISFQMPLYPPQMPSIGLGFGGMGMGMSYVPGQWFPIDLPAVNVGLGRDFKSGDRYDLDDSVTGMNDYGEIKESVYYSRKSGFNGVVRISGDNTTGKGHGDDEVMYITLSSIPHHITTLAIAISSYRGNSMVRARRAFVRLFEPHSRMELGRFILSRSFDCIGLLVGILHRNRQDGKWYLRVMTDPIPGNVITKSYGELKRIVPGYVQTFYH